MHNIKQIGGNTFDQWYENLWGKTNILKNIDRKQIIDKPNANMLFMNNMPIKFSFVPEIWDKNYTNTKPIKNNAKNYKILIKYFKSERWHEFLEYTFRMLRPYYFPNYNPETYYIDYITTSLENINSIIIIVIKGVIKKYSYEQIKNIYNKEGSLGKNWSDKIDENMTFDKFYDFITDAFYKSTEEGEMFIKGIGQLSLGIHTHMKLEKD
jgi:hypothetical protein